MASKRDAATGTKASTDVLVVAIVIYDPNRRQPANDFDVYTERSPDCACFTPDPVAAWTPHDALATVLIKPPDDA